MPTGWQWPPSTPRRGRHGQASPEGPQRLDRSARPERQDRAKRARRGHHRQACPRWVAGAAVGQPVCGWHTTMFWSVSCWWIWACCRLLGGSSCHPRAARSATARAASWPQGWRCLGSVLVSQIIVEYGHGGDVAGACSVESAATGSEVLAPEPAEVAAICKGLTLDEEMAASPTRFAEDAKARPSNRVASSRRKLF